MIKNGHIYFLSSKNKKKNRRLTVCPCSSLHFVCSQYSVALTTKVADLPALPVNYSYYAIKIVPRFTEKWTAEIFLELADADCESTCIHKLIFFVNANSADILLLFKCLVRY